MSDQPTTGGWTGITLSRLIQEKGYQGAAAAHNTALAAAFKAGRLEGVFMSPDEGEISLVRKLEAQLAAERDEWIVANRDLAIEVLKLREQLAAEREKWNDWHKFTDEGLAEYVGKQLATAVEKEKQNWESQGAFRVTEDHG